MADEELKFWTTPPNVFLVATSKEADNKVLGCISYRVINPTTVEMHRLSVDSSLRGLRIGEKLVNALQDTAKENGYEAMYLETSSAQIAAIKLYKRLQFNFLHRCKFEYPFLDIISGLYVVAFMKSLK